MKNTEIIELAIRMPKAGVQEDVFMQAKNQAVQKLISIKGIGPEREFAPVQTLPAQTQKVYVGMTRYASQWKVYQAMMNLGFMIKLMKFMGKMQPIAGIFLKPQTPEFDYLAFAGKESITEIVLLRAKKGADKKEFLQKRMSYLQKLRAEPEIEAVYDFASTGGFQNKDCSVHFIMHKGSQEADAWAVKKALSAYEQTFQSEVESVFSCVCETIK